MKGASKAILDYLCYTCTYTCKYRQQGREKFEWKTRKFDTFYTGYVCVVTI